MLVTKSDDKSVKVSKFNDEIEESRFRCAYFTKGNVTGLTLAENSPIGVIVIDLNEVFLFNWKTGRVG